REPGQPFASVIAQTTAHLDRIREVLLVWTLDPDIVADSMPIEEDEALPASTAPTGEAGE
ncbi:MAG: rod shape-determining protein MreC, partial [Candidatus Thiodiazotropha endolucinida]